MFTEDGESDEKGRLQTPRSCLRWEDHTGDAERVRGTALAEYTRFMEGLGVLLHRPEEVTLH
jgi:hypothetical protein